MQRLTVLVGTVVTACVIGCAASRSPADGVGDECRVSVVPEGGFSESSEYLESSNAQCPSNICLVDHLRGNPQHVCEGVPTDNPDCVGPETAAQRIYCTCPCDGSSSVTPLCACPSGFECRAVPGTDISFCFRE